MRDNAISVQELINKIKGTNNKTVNKVFVDVNERLYEITDFYIDDDEDVVLEIGDEV